MLGLFGSLSAILKCASCTGRSEDMILPLSAVLTVVEEDLRGLHPQGLRLLPRCQLNRKVVLGGSEDVVE